MITLIEAKNYRSLKAISQPMSHFHVLIGANATGKSTFLDVVRFVSNVVNFGIDRAVQERVAHLDELTFGGEGGDIELAVEVALPARIAQKFNGRNYQTIRYEVRFGKTPETLENAIHEERVLLLAPNAKPKPEDSAQPVLFPDYRPRDTTLLLERLTPKSYKRTISKKPNGNDNFYVETYEDSGKGWLPSFRLGIKKSALGNLPDDETKFPASTEPVGGLFDRGTRKWHPPQGYRGGVPIAVFGVRSPSTVGFSFASYSFYARAPGVAMFWQNSSRNY
jgi:hypothetical protein